MAMFNSKMSISHWENTRITLNPNDPIASKNHLLGHDPPEIRIAIITDL